MKLYHGSNCDFTAIDLSKSKDKRDFGKGFYLVRSVVADDRTNRTLALFIEGIYTAKMALRKLSYNKLNDQISIHTEQALSCLTLINKAAYGN